ncbi:MAG: hypothetical protein ACJ754_06810 [Pyrinomonadaceae bacterium]
MDQQLTNRDGVIRYLLGEADAGERGQVEKSFAADDTFFDFVIIEDQLIVDYLNGRLEERQRELFESNYLTASNGRRERVALARSLMNSAAGWEAERVDEQGAPGVGATSWGASVSRFFQTPQFAVLMVALAFVIVVTLFLKSQRKQLAALEQRLQMEQREFQQQRQRQAEDLSRQEEELRRQRDELEELRAQNEGLKRHGEELARVVEKYERDSEAKKAAGRPGHSETAQRSQKDFPLDPSGERGSTQSSTPVIKSGGRIRLYLKQRGASYESYTAELESESSPGSPKEFPSLTVQDMRFGKVVVLTLATRGLKPGAYVIALYGYNQQQGSRRSPVDSYHFRIK